MAHKRLLLGSFDVMHVGHLTQITALASPDVELTIAVLSDEGVRVVSRSEPFMPAHERAALVAGLRLVSTAVITGPETGWALPEHDSLYGDAKLLQDLAEVDVVDLHDSAGVIELRSAQPVIQTAAPAHPALARTA